jgi:hypothetical protein
MAHYMKLFGDYTITLEKYPNPPVVDLTESRRERMVSWLAATPRSNSSSWISRKLSVNRW